jgi:plastocyanin
VGAGDPVVFSNADGVVHTVTAGSVNDPGDAFDSGNISPGQIYQATFEDPGTYSFFCALHPQMNGRIVVEG